MSELSYAEKLAYVAGVNKGKGSGVTSVNGKTGAVTVYEIPDHGIKGQVLTATGTDARAEWADLPVWDGTVDEG